MNFVNNADAHSTLEETRRLFVELADLSLESGRVTLRISSAHVWGIVYGDLGFGTWYAKAQRSFFGRLGARCAHLFNHLLLLYVMWAQGRAAAGDAGKPWERRKYNVAVKADRLQTLYLLRLHRGLGVKSVWQLAMIRAFFIDGGYAGPLARRLTWVRKAAGATSCGCGLSAR